MEYSFGEMRSELKFVSVNEGAVNADANFRIFQDDPVTPTVSITLVGTTLHYEIVTFDIDKMLLYSLQIMTYLEKCPVCNR